MIFVTKTKLPSLVEYNQYLKRIWKNNWLTNDGELLRELEDKLVKHLGINNIVLTTNATIALQVAIKALDLKGEVITTPFTFIASTNVIIWENLTPVFADVDKTTYNIDPDDIERKITPKTCAILAVHVYGNPCDVEKIEKIAKKHNLKVIYDAAHAFGVKYKNKSILSYGDVSVLSFHATKVFNTIEGGALITNNVLIHKKIKLLRNFGIESEEVVLLAGTNAKMSEFQAAMGLCKLRVVETEMKKRKMLYEKYLSGLNSIYPDMFQELSVSKYNYSYMPILLKNKDERDLVYNKLKENNIYARKYFYPLTCDFIFTKKFLPTKVNNSLSNSREISNRVLCLPLYPDLTCAEVEAITRIIRSLCVSKSQNIE